MAGRVEQIRDTAPLLVGQLDGEAHTDSLPVGRKTDVRDAEWIADLLRHGLLRASFIPVRADRELRELVRYRTTLVRERHPRSTASYRLAVNATNAMAITIAG